MSEHPPTHEPETLVELQVHPDQMIMHIQAIMRLAFQDVESLHATNPKFSLRPHPSARTLN